MDKAKESEHIAQRFNTAVEKGDRPSLEALYSSSAVIWHNFDKREQSRSDNIAVVANLAAMFPEFRYENIRVVVTSFGYVQQHDAVGRNAAGKKFCVPACLVVTVTGGLIERIEEYFDSYQVNDAGAGASVQNTPSPQATPKRDALAGKVAVITGAASGIGKSIATIFVSEGARVLVSDINEEKGRAVARSLGADAEFQLVDVRREADIEAMIAEAEKRFGRLDILVNNAGSLGVAGPIEELELEAYHKTMDLLLTSSFLATKYAVPLLRAQRGGNIVNIASIAGMRGDPQGLVYTAAKAGVMGLTRAAALQLAPYNIRVNAIAPGGIVTPVYDAILQWGPEGPSEEKLRAILKRQQPLQQAGEPDDIGNMAAFLASDRAKFITGQSFAVDGGLTAVMSAAVESMRSEQK